MRTVYLDHMATTPVDKRVLEAMLPFFTERFGNPASKSHSYGWDAADAIAMARQQVAAAIGAGSERAVVFTSGATESVNLALKGVVQVSQHRRPHVIFSATEHKAVLDCCRRLALDGCRTSELPVDAAGCVDPRDLDRALTPETVLVSIMAANNEIGTVQPLAEIGAVMRETPALWHCDGAQAVGKMDFDVQQLGIDLLSLSGHKIYAPKGVGALYVRAGKPLIRLRSQIDGGGQERRLRAGTLNVPGIVGLGKACVLCATEMQDEALRLEALRHQLWSAVLAALPNAVVNGHPRQRLPGCLSMSFAGVDGTALLPHCRDVALSAGSACTSGASGPSHVLAAIGLEPALAQATLRVGLGRHTTSSEVALAADRIIEAVRRSRTPSSS